MMQNMIQQMIKGNPLYKRAEKMAQGKSEDELKQVAVNLCQQRGININEAYKQFQNFMCGMNR